VLSEVLFADYIEPEAKQQLVKPLFVAYAGIDADELLDFASLQADASDQDIGVHGVQLRSGQKAIAMTLEHTLAAEELTRTISAIALPSLFERATGRADAFEAVVIDAQGRPVTEVADADGDIRWKTVRVASSISRMVTSSILRAPQKSTWVGSTS
jgi:hypothetical protein